MKTESKMSVLNMSLFCRRSAPISDAKAIGGDIIMWPGISIMTSLVAMDSIAVAPLTPPVVSRLGHSILGNLAPFVSSHFLKTVMSSSSAIISSVITGGYEPDGQSFRGGRHQVIDERLHFLRPVNPFNLSALGQLPRVVVPSALYAYEVLGPRSFGDMLRHM